ncbi:MAG TPA: hypothetical protein VF546_05455 [Pyrinomonadaceae bacterium]|jgi:hypothetical protein
MPRHTRRPPASFNVTRRAVRILVNKQRYDEQTRRAVTEALASDDRDHLLDVLRRAERHQRAHRLRPDLRRADRP